jgi:hypothetical protein
LFPILETESGDSDMLLYNLHSDAQLGKAIDILLSCVQQQPTQREHHCTTVTELLLVQDSSWSPTSVNFAPIFPAHDPDTLVGIIQSKFVWEQLIEDAFSSPVSGMDVVLQTSLGDAFTFTMHNGVAMAKGPGDLHDKTFDHYNLARSREIRDDPLFADDAIGYILHLHPNQDLYSTYPSGNPQKGAMTTVGAVLVVSLLFFWYDFFLRRTSSHCQERALGIQTTIRAIHFP